MLLVFKEIVHRKFNFLMGLIGMIALVAFVVAFYTMTQATQKETIRLTRDMGFNVRIIPGESDMNQFWVEGYSNLSMSQNVVDKLVSQKSVNYAHLTATLHKRVQWQGKDVVLTGISSKEREPSGAVKSKMIFAIEENKVYLGYEVANQFHIKEGDIITIFEKEFQVSKTLTESGSEDDVRIYFDLKTLQGLIKMEGRVNEVMAINCMCSTKNGDPLSELRAELAKIAPEAKVIMKSSVADAREKQRKMTDKYFSFLFPVVLIICALLLGSVVLTNVKTRTHEIGIMRAIGFSGWHISKQFFLRAFILGFIGALIGFVVGTLLSYQLGPNIFKVAKTFISPNYSLLLWAILIGPLFAAMVSVLPVLWFVNQDAAQLLKEQ
ncbi:ABC transporter permease [Flavivirga spongiicola]|uniref:ABC transporter permease n=1 Tax=Flavivirga spongiicola TaxID=421621 RepID=A0ABU7XPD9_9FLAO|nr:ABC transporter permease [Flavivirga sp. MEBiC05379]MDO5977411.1 FtsX-like permease family protein [Flavivirga sp. MEBiC05379]